MIRFFFERRKLTHEQDDEFNIFTERLTGKFKAQFSKFSVEEQESYSQENMNLRALLGLDPDHVYTVDNFSSEVTLERALRLLFNARYGHDDISQRISPHKHYGASIAPEFKNVIKSKKIQLRKTI